MLFPDHKTLHVSKKNLILAGFIILKIALQYVVINPVYDLHRDEYLHLDQAKHLAWGYMSVPPVTSWISYLILLLGNSVFWIKFFPALFGALTIFVVWKTVEELKGGLFALILSALCVLFSVLLRINILYQPNSLDILLWTTCYFCIVKYISTEQTKWLYYLAAAFAFGFLNKYNLAFLLLGLLPALLLTRHRVLVLKKHFYFSVLLAFLIILPNLIWQYTNNFPVFHHLKELTETQLENVNRADFLKEQILFFIGSIFVIIAAFISFFTYKPFKNYRLFFWTYAFTLLIFIYFRAKGYYAIGLYPIFIAFGSVYLEHLLKEKWRVYLRPLAVALPVILFIPMIRVIFPVNSPAVIKKNSQAFKDLGLLRWEDGKDHELPQDFADMLGWKELAQHVDSAYNSINDKEHTLVLCDNYGEAGAINYYSKVKNMAAVSFSADYINWLPLAKKINHVILIKEIDEPENSHDKELFETIDKFATVNNPFAREKGTTIYIMRNAKADINQHLENRLKNEIAENLGK